MRQKDEERERAKERRRLAVEAALSGASSETDSASTAPTTVTESSQAASANSSRSATPSASDAGEPPKSPMRSRLGTLTKTSGWKAVVSKKKQLKDMLAPIADYATSIGTYKKLALNNLSDTSDGGGTVTYKQGSNASLHTELQKRASDVDIFGDERLPISDEEFASCDEGDDRADEYLEIGDDDDNDDDGDDETPRPSQATLDETIDPTNTALVDVPSDLDETLQASSIALDTTASADASALEYDSMLTHLGDRGLAGDDEESFMPPEVTTLPKSYYAGKRGTRNSYRIALNQDAVRADVSQRAKLANDALKQSASEGTEEADDQVPVTSVSMYLDGEEDDAPVQGPDQTLLLCHDTSMMPSNTEKASPAADESVLDKSFLPVEHPAKKRSSSAPRVASPLATSRPVTAPAVKPLRLSSVSSEDHNSSAEEVLEQAKEDALAKKSEETKARQENNMKLISRLSSELEVLAVANARLASSASQEKLNTVGTKEPEPEQPTAGTTPNTPSSSEPAPLPDAADRNPVKKKVKASRLRTLFQSKKQRKKKSGSAYGSNDDLLNGQESEVDLLAKRRRSSSASNPGSKLGLFGRRRSSVAKPPAAEIVEEDDDFNPRAPSGFEDSAEAVEDPAPTAVSEEQGPEPGRRRGRDSMAHLDECILPDDDEDDDPELDTIVRYRRRSSVQPGASLAHDHLGHLTVTDSRMSMRIANELELDDGSVSPVLNQDLLMKQGAQENQASRTSDGDGVTPRRKSSSMNRKSSELNPRPIDVQPGKVKGEHYQVKTVTHDSVTETII